MKPQHSTLISQSLFGSEGKLVSISDTPRLERLKPKDIFAWVNDQEKEPFVRFGKVISCDSALIRAKFIDNVSDQGFINARAINLYFLYDLKRIAGFSEFFDLIEWSVTEYSPIDPSAKNKIKRLSLLATHFFGIRLSTPN